jgi:hypothetical protein
LISSTIGYAHKVIAYCTDVGSVPGNAFGWARATKESGSTAVRGGPSIDALLDLLADDLGRGRWVSLGIEAPLFLPVPTAKEGLSRGRDGDGNRSCFAPAGGYVTTLGLHELAYMLRWLKDRVPTMEATLDWSRWCACPVTPLLLWEAFVSGDAHTTTKSHVQDAASGAVTFLDVMHGQEPRSAVTIRADTKTLSLAGAALLWAGLATELDTLRQPTLVVKPATAWKGDVVG